MVDDGGTLSIRAEGMPDAVDRHPVRFLNHLHGRMRSAMLFVRTRREQLVCMAGDMQADRDQCGTSESCTIL